MNLNNLNPYTSTDAEFDAAAHKYANTFWLFLVITVIFYYFWGWVGAVIPGFLALWSARLSINCTAYAAKLRN